MAKRLQQTIKRQKAMMDQLKNSLNIYMEYKDQTEGVVESMKQHLSREKAMANKLTCSPMVSY